MNPIFISGVFGVANTTFRAGALIVFFGALTDFDGDTLVVLTLVIRDLQTLHIDMYSLIALYGTQAYLWET